MIIDPKIVDSLEELGAKPWEGLIFRDHFATRDPLAPSRAGGRWAPPGEFHVLYTCLERAGAIAEGDHRNSLYSIPPSKPRRLCTIEVKLNKVIDLSAQDRLATLGVDTDRFAEEWGRCPEIGAAANFLQYQGILAPSARLGCHNLMILTDQADSSCLLEIVSDEDFPVANGRSRL